MRFRGARQKVRMFLQTSPWTSLLFFTFATLLLLVIHLESEVGRLDRERIRLELAVNRIEQSGGSFDHGARRAPAAYVQQDTQTPIDGDDTVVIYNRVPKTGSTSFAGIAYELCNQNKFHVLHINVTKNNHVLSLSDQMRFVSNVTNWSSKKPAFYHGHLAFVDFARFGAGQKPVYINLVRDPLDRLVSYYYFVRHGDDFRPHLKRRKAGDRESFDDCVAKSGSDCDPQNLWMQIPFFCGHSAQCWIPGNVWALETAKQNLINNYLVVGLTEELGDFVAVLEATLPRFFTGATHLYNTGRKSHLRKTFNKTVPSQATVDKIHQSKVWQMEQNFYEFAKTQFDFMKKRTFEYNNGYMQEKSQQFSYEKIRPR